MAAWSCFSGCSGGEKQHGLEEVQRARTDEAVLGDGVAWVGAVFFDGLSARSKSASERPAMPADPATTNCRRERPRRMG